MILHIDMDAFYAAIEQRDNPSLRGRPVVVGGTSVRGVVAAASYEARRFGIHSAMSSRRAHELCPNAVFLPTRIAHYADVGHQVRQIFHRYTPLVQPLSLDEAFLDVGGSQRLFGDAASIGRQIKQAIDSELQLTASVGVAPLKFVAKIASDLGKPNGFVEVPPQGVIEFLDPLPVTRLWGVGRAALVRLHQLNVNRIGDLRAIDPQLLRDKLGSWGEHLWRLANGIGPRKVVPDRTAKAISNERTFHDDICDEETLRAVISYLSEQVAGRLRRCGHRAKTVGIKYRREDFQTFARSKTLRDATHSTDEIFTTAVDLLTEMRRRQPRPVRLLGVSASSLSAVGAPTQMSLFEAIDQTHDRRQVDKVVDRLRDQLGGESIYRATSHQWIHRKRKD